MSEDHAAAGIDRPLRADAARNRALILRAAQDLFAEAGLEVGVEEIARRAGVGKGTLYRRFPTKDDLVCAIFDSHLEEVERLAAVAHAEPDAWTGFARFLEGQARMQADNQGFLDVVAQGQGAILTPSTRARFLDIIAASLARAQAAGAVRDDLVPEDVLFLLRMIGSTTRAAPDGTPMEERWLRYLALVLDALRPVGATPLPADAWHATIS
jgi:AcrR family transcriptional regulator